MRQSIITADPLELSRDNDVVVKMQELSERLRTLGNAILYPQMFAPMISVVGRQVAATRSNLRQYHGAGL